MHVVHAATAASPGRRTTDSIPGWQSARTEVVTLTSRPWETTPATPFALKSSSLASRVLLERNHMLSLVRRALDVPRRGQLPPAAQSLQRGSSVTTRAR